MQNPTWLELGQYRSLNSKNRPLIQELYPFPTIWQRGTYLLLLPHILYPLQTVHLSQLTPYVMVSGATFGISVSCKLYTVEIPSSSNADALFFFLIAAHIMHSLSSSLTSSSPLEVRFPKGSF